MSEYKLVPVEPTAEMVEIDYPDFHWQGMGCGLEDRNITDRYEAMRYGWEAALDRVAEDIDSLGPLYTTPQPAPDVAGLVKVLCRSFPLLDNEGLDEVEHHCEWSIQQERWRLHAIIKTFAPETLAACQKEVVGKQLCSN